MQYNSESNSEDCISEILAICNATIVTYTANDITRRFNRGMDDYWDIAMNNQGAWPFDDTNQTTSAIVTQDLVSGTNKYKISAFTGSAVGILGVSILDSDAVVHPLAKEEFYQVQFESDYATTNTGTPAYYLLYGNWIYLRATPDYNETNGLRVYADRDPLYMSPSDTTKEPGVPKKHHLYLCRKAALPYLIEKKLKHMSAIAQLIKKDEQEIKRYYARRDKTLTNRLTSWFNSSKYSDSNK
jgi:hypothetical protein